MAVSQGRGQEHFSDNSLNMERGAIRVEYENRGYYSPTHKLIYSIVCILRATAFLEFCIRFRLSFCDLDLLNSFSGKISHYHYPVLFRL